MTQKKRKTKKIKTFLISAMAFAMTSSYLYVPNTSGKQDNIAEAISVGQTWNYDYTGGQQTWTAPSSGEYQLEVWGAQGGGDSSYPGGKGGYSKGTVTLRKGETLYVHVGGKGVSNNGVHLSGGGYNGGGNTFVNPIYGLASGGGGATDIRKGTTSLGDRIVVAGGGGGGANMVYGGAGGGSTGQNGETYLSGQGGLGGTQTSGNALGQGGDSRGRTDAQSSGGGGGGYYGGFGGNTTTSSSAGVGNGFAGGGGGGSGYIGGVNGGQMIAGNTSMPNPTGGTMVGKENNGYAKITLNQLHEEYIEKWNFNYTGSSQTFTAPEMGVYVLEAWGAEGGNDSTTLGGKGGYAKGEFILNKGESLQINVGGNGIGAVGAGGGWNGGGNSGPVGASGGGGGATDYRFGGSWLQNRILVAGGGGGASVGSAGGAGGGLFGFPGLNGGGSGASQTVPGFGGGTGLLGKGADKILFDENSDGILSSVEGDGGGGGGGYYGGGGGLVDTVNGGGGGGSSYIGGVGNGVTIAGNAVMPNPSGGTMTGKAGAGYAKITLKELKTVTPGTTWDFAYTGSYQTFIAPNSGKYQITAWGAKGGNDSGIGGNGGYATGEVTLDKGEVVQIYVGGKGGTSVQNSGGGWNGGGHAGPYGTSGGGGGATDFRLKGHDLNQRILVAGGGGGAGAASNGGAGGGLLGISATNNGGDGATQTYGGAGGGGGTFGKGGDKVPYDGNNDGVLENGESDGGGGGGGYYGGGAGFVEDGTGSGGGGSSYIGGVVNGSTIAGNAVMPTPSGSTMTGNAEDGFAQIKLVQQTENAKNGEKWSFPFSGSYRVFTAPHAGYYNLETWGAKGGNDSKIGGNGAYAQGDIFLSKGEKIFIYVGEKGKDSAYYNAGGGWNGGGGTGPYGSSGGGGGATDIRKVGHDLKYRILVAGAGGGAGAGVKGGAGGGLVGFIGEGNGGSGGTQNAGGAGAEPGSLGKGGDKKEFDHNQDGTIEAYERDGGGGGAGYYGGGAGYADSVNGSGGGGSSYIDSVSNGSTLDGNSVMPNPFGGSMNGNEQNGYARITLTKIYIGKDVEKWEFNHTANAQTFVAPQSGFYQLEAWGAQGGISGHANTVGGKGGYAKGYIYLEKNQKLFVYVGGDGNSTAYNGGGGSDYASPKGGGATDFRTASDGTWSANLNSRILVAGGGGGAEWPDAHGGAGGGLSGNDGTMSTYTPGTGGTQTSGGLGEAANGTFGLGGIPATGVDAGGGGGGGYYGGGTPIVASGGGGGSSYVGGVSDGTTISGNEKMPHPVEGTMQGKTGHGYAKVTLIEGYQEEYDEKWNFNYTGNAQTFTAPYAGFYQLETWGAQGALDNGGNGGYAKGSIFLKKNEQITIYVGGHGGNPTGGWNGGGNGGSSFGKFGAGGGGATDIRFKGTTLTHRILVAGGAGGGHASSSYGGGLVAGGGQRFESNDEYLPKGTYYTQHSFGGSQTAGGEIGQSNDSIGISPTKGALGIGGTGGTGAVENAFNYNAGGGGGGYYGGAGGQGSGAWLGIQGAAGGGSSYIDGVSDGFTVSGNTTMPNPSGGVIKGKTGHGYAKISLMQKYEEPSNEKWEFDYIGGVHTFTAPYSGIYNLQAWGAEGVGTGGHGGYAKGDMYLAKNQTIYVYVGGKGDFGGWNGGGNGGSMTAVGGGATDFRTASNGKWDYNLDTRVLVAGGGGGTEWSKGYGGAGGGLRGQNGFRTDTAPYFEPGTGGTQTSGGIGEYANGFFGKGGDGVGDGGGAGGGGWFGGGTPNIASGGGGGSSYIGGVLNGVTIGGNTNIPSPTGDSMQGKAGNGYATIVLVENYEEESIKKWDFDYTGNAQTFIAPHTGYYRLETWGAEGTSVTEGIAGKGGYSRGKIYLEKDEELYVYVGGKAPVGGWNGGGISDGMYAAGGGGATDIRLTRSTDPLNNASLLSRILVAGGGGGAERVQGGAGGGLIGQSGQRYLHYTTYVATGGTQSEGGVGALNTVHGQGESGGFGYGGSSSAINGVTDVAGGGGGGYYGGGATTHAGGAGGGSSYIDGVLDGSTIAGNLSMPNPSGDAMVGKSGAGYASIRLLAYDDNDQPLGTLTANPTAFTNGNVTITAIGTDSDSGYKHMMLPNGVLITNATATYTVTTNGTYSFTFVDNAGNTLVKSITISNIDKIAPVITFTPEDIAGSYQDLSVTVLIEDAGVSGVKQYRSVWTKNQTIPTTGWSDWEVGSNPIITQKDMGKWYLHLEAEDYAGNKTYGFSGFYEKLMLAGGGPSVNLNVYPIPTGKWNSHPIDVYIMESGDSELLAKAQKFYEVTTSPLYPTNFDQDIPLDKKVQLNIQGENFIHVQYILDDGTKVSSTAGPYLIDSGNVGAFNMKLVDAFGNEVNDWSNQSVKLVMSDPSIPSVSGVQKQYRIEGLHTDWQPYAEHTMIAAEGKYRILGRIVNGANQSSDTLFVESKIDRGKPVLSKLTLEEKENRYSLSLKAEDVSSGIKEIRTNDGTKLNQEKTLYKVNGLVGKPTSVLIEDFAGNELIVTTEEVPSITFDAPYNLNDTVYRRTVKATITQATNYQWERQSYDCVSDACAVPINQNGTLIARKINGIKESVKSITLDNINQTPLRLLLNGKREGHNPNKINFTWNYQLTDATLQCIEGGTANTYTVSGTSVALSAQNFTYDCHLTGNYGGEVVVSNQIIVSPLYTAPIVDGGGVLGGELDVNVYMKDSMIGKSYLINTRSKNTEGAYVPIPMNEITQD